MGSRSITSTRSARGGSRAAACLISASAVYRPARPEPTTATSSCLMAADYPPQPGCSCASSGMRLATASVMARARSCGVRPASARNLAALAVLEEALRQAEDGDRARATVSRSDRATASPNPPTRPLSSTVTTSRCVAAPRQRLVERLDPARIDHGDPDALTGQPLGHLGGYRGHRACPEQQHVRPGSAGQRQHVHAAQHPDRRDIGARSAAREPERGRAVADRDRLAQQLGQPGTVRGTAIRSPARAAGSSRPTCRDGWRRPAR